MTASGIKRFPENLKSGKIAIDSYENKIPTGRLSYSHLEEEKEFYGAIPLLLLLEETLEEMDYTGGYTKLRRFTPVDSPDAILTPGLAAETDTLPGKLGTFGIKIIFRQNSSWQGTLTWQEGGMDVSFRSALELMMLIDSALSGQ